MGERKDYIWMAPLIGGILSLIAFFTPAAGVQAGFEYFRVWMWGLISFQIYDPFWDVYERQTLFTPNPDIYIPSLICSISIFICALVLIITSASYPKRMKYNKENPTIWLGFSLPILGFTIAWIVIMEFVGSSSSGPSFWSFMIPGFGVIGLFIGVILSLIGYGIARMHLKRKKEITKASTKDIPSSISEEKVPVQITLQFCPNCGNKILAEYQKFCINCGFKFEDIRP